jgi:predicted outer membrane repeat protein
MFQQFCRRGALAPAILRISLTVALSIPAALSAQQVVRVPTEQPSLQAAITAVPDNGVIELAAGTYSAPQGGWSIDTAASGKGFTIRAAAGATVIFSGQDTHDIIRFANPATGGRPLTFQGLTFADGVSTTDFIGGGLTVVHANATFVSCTFRNNAANPATTGGGALWLFSATVSFQQCTWTNNNSRNYGAAISASDSRVFLRDCSFSNNSTNLPNHSPTSLGGAINNTNSAFRIDNCRFENNQAGYVGGAIFCGGTWRSPENVPSVDLQVSNSLFIGNLASSDPSVIPPSPPLGGAIHVEDQTTARFVNCRFVNNSARQGGAISSYRAITEFNGCVFEGNTATGANGAEGVGGSIFAQSDDVPDSSTNGGTINRRSIVLNVRDSLFSGFGATNALHGGAIFVTGDLNAAYGRRGMTQNGTEASNRATVNLTNVGFENLFTTGTGGAISGSFAAVTMDRSIIENCRTAGDGAGLRLPRRDHGRWSSVLWRNTKHYQHKTGRKPSYRRPRSGADYRSGHRQRRSTRTACGRNNSAVRF